VRCKPIRLALPREPGDETSGFLGGVICYSSTKGPRPRCRWCSVPSTALCDYVIGVTLANKPITCDAPMCDAHRTRTSGARDLCPRHLLEAS
jgi:hypothetical protein